MWSMIKRGKLQRGIGIDEPSDAMKQGGFEHVDESYIQVPVHMPPLKLK